MTEWKTPKTDWYGATDAKGIYTGDRFNVEDYNRIKGNIEHLYNLAMQVVPDFEITSLDDKVVGSYMYADEINAIEENLEEINNKVTNLNIGEKSTYYANGAMIDYNELNRIENASAILYNKIKQRYEHRRMLAQQFEKGGMSWL